MIEDKIEGGTVVSSSVSAIVKTMSGKWKPSIILHLIDQDLRYGILRQAMPAVSEKMLIQQLKELRKEGIVMRKTYADIPLRVEYGLTAYGHTMRPLLELLSTWGTAHLAHQVALAQKQAAFLLLPPIFKQALEPSETDDGSEQG